MSDMAARSVAAASGERCFSEASAAMSSNAAPSVGPSKIGFSGDAPFSSRICRRRSSISSSRVRTGEVRTGGDLAFGDVALANVALGDIASVELAFGDFALAGDGRGRSAAASTTPSTAAKMAAAASLESTRVRFGPE